VTIEPFRLDVPVSELDDLRRRLDGVRWPAELPGAEWSRGVPLAYLQDLVAYWRDGYDWRAAEAGLNEWPQYTTEIDGARVHFAQIRSSDPSAVPLVLTHGWPGSIVEFTEVAKLLTDFHLVIPTIPGFSLSGPVQEPGWEFKRVARAWTELMTRLGYERYGVQGGDWGAAISREVGRIDPERVIGVHLNLIPGAGATSEPTPEELAPLDAAEQERTWASWRRQQEFVSEQPGYADLQSTRPQTLAYALTDSPVGQLAWIAEKFATWSDPAAPIDRDALLTNVMLYLGHPDRGIGRRDLPRTRACVVLGSAARAGPHADGAARPRPRELHPTAAQGGPIRQHRPLDQPPPRRPLRGPGTTLRTSRRHPGLLRGTSRWIDARGPRSWVTWRARMGMSVGPDRRTIVAA
jgi:pimeloyl-ACP methyl ester carboxylesterase